MAGSPAWTLGGRDGVRGGLGPIHAMTAPRAMLVESRPFEGMPVLPGTRWHDPEPDMEDLDLGDEDDLLLEEPTVG